MQTEESDFQLEISLRDKPMKTNDEKELRPKEAPDMETDWPPVDGQNCGMICDTTLLLYENKFVMDEICTSNDTTALPKVP
jgi:hypothetical protein